MDSFECSSSNICKFCDQSVGKYTCPRCNFNYCSVACYRSQNHSNCSEAFYKECVEEELKLQESDVFARNSMMEILKRNAVENFVDSEDSDDDTNLEDRLKGINLDETEEVWSKLTSEEQKEFLELARAGDISKYVPMWEPWWSKTHRKSKVMFVDSSSSSSEDDYKLSCPKIYYDIPSLEKISKSNPSPLIFNNLLNVIAAYSMMVRFFNGDHIQLSDDASCLLMDLSKNISNNVNFDTLDLAIESVSLEATNKQTIGATRENINHMKSDLVKIALGPNEDELSYYILAALSDCVSLLQVSVSTKQHSLATVKKTSLPVVFEKKLEVSYTKKAFKLAKKKIHYYLSWVNTYYSDIINEYKQSLMV